MEIPSWVRQLFQSIDGKDADAFAAYLSDRAEFRYGSQPSVSGRGAVRDHVAGFFAGMAGLEHELLGFWWGVPDRLCFVQGEVTYTLADGRRLIMPFLNQFRMSDAGIERYLIYADPSPLLA